MSIALKPVHESKVFNVPTKPSKNVSVFVHIHLYNMFLNRRHDTYYLPDDRGLKRGSEGDYKESNCF